MSLTHDRTCGSWWLPSKIQKRGFTVNYASPDPLPYPTTHLPTWLYPKKRTGGHYNPVFRNSNYTMLTPFRLSSKPFSADALQ